jgi:Kef-type K+ transport system membrane component KefB
VFHGKIRERGVSGHPVSMTIALCLSAAIFALAFRVFAFPRVWSYLLLGAVMTATNETGTIIDADQIVDFLSTDLHSGEAIFDCCWSAA